MWHEMEAEIRDKIVEEGNQVVEKRDVTGKAEKVVVGYKMEDYIVPIVGKVEQQVEKEDKHFAMESRALDLEEHLSKSEAEKSQITAGVLVEVGTVVT